VESLYVVVKFQQILTRLSGREAATWEASCIGNNIHAINSSKDYLCGQCKFFHSIIVLTCVSALL